ncbi:hypothetical protein ACFSR7_10575 [Cohnella sp. GCM10020058]|uniref:hypothetical protein n=1 Tax=Cohnella sp. GCM10020058 TaxID=3317330 RepID=UPI0036446EF9
MAGLKTYICTGIFCRLATVDEMPANMQVNSKRMPEMGLMAENNCLLASILHKKDDISKKNCIFAGFKAEEKTRRHQKRSCIFAGFKAEEKTRRHQKKGCIFAGVAAKKRRWRRYAGPSEGRLFARSNAKASSGRH